MTLAVASEDQQHSFWTWVFEENNLAHQLPKIARETDEISFSSYGQVEVKASPASALGDNLMSDAYIVDARRSDKKDPKSLTAFVKVLPLNPMMRMGASMGRVYQREIGVYRDLFPLLREFRGNKPIPLDVPEMYYSRSDQDDQTCIVFENLKAKGFRLTEKTRGSDYHHARLVVTSLAHYHSLTMAAMRKWIQKSSNIREYTYCIMNYPDKVQFLEEKSMLEKDPVGLLQDLYNNLIELTSEVERPDLTEWLQEINLHQVGLIETMDSAGEMACILHGDYWNNNLMFHYDSNGQPDALRMVDFQIVRTGHPMNDLLYFFYSSTLPEMRAKHMMELFHLYFDILTDNLKMLETPSKYSWDEFMNDYKKRSKAGFLMGAMVVSVIFNARAIVSDLQNMNDDEIRSSPKADNPVKKEDCEESVGLREKMMNAFKKPKWSNNQILTDRLLALITEVKNLNTE